MICQQMYKYAPPIHGAPGCVLNMELSPHARILHLTFQSNLAPSQERISGFVVWKQPRQTIIELGSHSILNTSNRLGVTVVLNRKVIIQPSWMGLPWFALSFLPQSSLCKWTTLGRQEPCLSQRKHVKDLLDDHDDWIIHPVIPTWSFDQERE